MFDDIFWMKAALQQALMAYDEGEIPVGAIIVAGDRVVGKGRNATEALSDVTAHAEIQAITAATQTIGGKYLEDCTMYVTLEPCPMCAGALYWSHVGRLVYGASDTKHGYTVFNKNLLHPRTEVTSGVMAEDCASLLIKFFKERR